MGTEKNLVFKVSSAVDDQGFRGLGSWLETVERQADRMSKSLSRALGVLGEGPLNQTPGGQELPKGFAQARATSNAASGGGLLGRGAEGLASGWSKVADAGQAAAQKLVDHLRQAAQGGDTHVARIVAGFEKITRAAHLSTAAVRESGAAPTYSFSDPVQGPHPFMRGPRGARRAGGLAERLAQTEEQVEEVQEYRKARRASEKALMGAVGQGGGGEKPPPKPPGGRGDDGIPSWVPGANLLGMIRTAGPWAAAGYAAYKGVDYLTNAVGNVRTANTEEALNYKPWYDLQLQASAGRTFGGSAMSILGGDLASAQAWRRTYADPRFKELMGDEMTTRRLELGATKLGLPNIIDPRTGKALASSQGVTFQTVGHDVNQRVQQTAAEWGSKLGDVMGESASKGMSKAFTRAGDLLEKLPTGSTYDFAGRVLKYAGEKFDALTNPRSKEDKETPGQIGTTRLAAQVTQDKIAEAGRMAREYQESDPAFNFISSRLMGGGFGTMSLLRAAGMGQREVRDKATGNVIGYSGDLAMARLEKSGFERGEGAAMNAAVARTAGRGMMGAGFGLLGAQAGGLFNAAELYGTGAQMGQAKGFFGAVQGAIGRGGLDITAGAELAGVVGQHALAGPAMSGADKAFEAIAGAAYVPGRTAGEDLRATRMTGGGLQEMSKLLGGKTDPLGQAITRRSALIGAHGNTYKADALERFMANPVQLMQAVKDGKLPEGLAALGLKPEDLQTALKEQNLQNTVRTIKRGLPEGAAGDFARSLSTHQGDMGGTIRDLLTEKMGKGKVTLMEALRSKKTLSATQKKESDRLEKEAYEIYSPGLKGFAQIQASNIGGNPDEIEQLLEQQASLGGFGRRARGAGAHDTIGKDAPERSAALARGKLAEQESQEKCTQSFKMADNAKNADLSVQIQQAMQQAFSGLKGTDLASAEKRMAGAVDEVEKALHGLANAINRVSGVHDTLPPPRRLGKKD